MYNTVSCMNVFISDTVKLCTTFARHVAYYPQFWQYMN